MIMDAAYSNLQVFTISLLQLKFTYNLDLAIPSRLFLHIFIFPSTYMVLYHQKGIVTRNIL